MSEPPFFRDATTGKPCPRRGNVMCALPYDPDHRHTWVGYESLTPSTPDPTPDHEADAAGRPDAFRHQNGEAHFRSFLHGGGPCVNPELVCTPVWFTSTDPAKRDAEQRAIGAEQALIEAANEWTGWWQFPRWLRERAAGVRGETGT